MREKEGNTLGHYEIKQNPQIEETIESPFPPPRAPPPQQKAVQEKNCPSLRGQQRAPLGCESYKPLTPVGEMLQGIGLLRVRAHTPLQQMNRGGEMTSN